jgi:dCTP deaminase
MSLLSYVELCELVEQGVIGPVDPKAINAASIDVRLGDEILVEEDSNQIISLKERKPLAMRKINIADSYYDLMPGESILAATIEKFYLPKDISCEYKLKSSMARIFLEHLHAGWADSGFNNSVLTLEFCNLSRFHRIRLHPGDYVGQICFFRHSDVPEHRSYKTIGRYNNCETVEHIKP